MNPTEKAFQEQIVEAGRQRAFVFGAIVPYVRRTYRGKFNPEAQRYHESQKAIAWQLKQQLIPIGEAHFRLGCTFWITLRSFSKDFDNLEKAVLDALQYAGIIKNDRYMVGHAIGYVDRKIKSETDMTEIILQIVGQPVAPPIVTGTEEVRRSREELSARLFTNYLDDDGHVVAGTEDFKGGV